MDEQLKLALRRQYLVGYWTHNQLKDYLHLSDQEIEDVIGTRLCRAKPRMLFLDDRTKRVESARRQFGEKYDLTIVSNVKECLRKLSDEDWDEVRLDHDLNGEDFQDPYDPTSGMQIVRYIETCGWPENKPKPVFRVHSSNIFAAHLMVKKLQNLGLIAVWERFEYKEAS